MANTFMKFCKYCNNSFSLEDIHWKIEKSISDIRYRCVKYLKDKSSAHYNNNKIRLKTIRSLWWKNNRHKLINKRKQYYIEHIEEARKRNRIYKLRPEVRLKDSIGRSIKRCLFGNKGCFRYLSFTKDQLKIHLQNLFKDGMNWSNYGIAGWHIDHIIPLKYKNTNGSYYWDQEELADPNSDTFKKAWALDNLQPLWAKDNIKKRNYYCG